MRMHSRRRIYNEASNVNLACNSGKNTRYGPDKATNAGPNFKRQTQ